VLGKVGICTATGAMAGALLAISFEREPAPLLRLTLPEVPAQPALHDPPSEAVVHATEVAPLGIRVAPVEPLLVRFDAEVDRVAVERGLELDPPSGGRFDWPDARTLRFVPDGWRQGRTVRVRLSAEGVAPQSWHFRAGIPEPPGIAPGRGQPIVLSFDDGPERPRDADRLLDLLAQNDARVLFFPSGRWARTRPDWVARAVREGHRICNHTFSHKKLTESWMSDADIRFEIENGASDGSCRYFRPPMMAAGARVERIARELGFELFYWDVDSRDWEDAPAEDVENLVLARARPGAVVLLHMHARGTLRALPSLLERLRGAGYRLTHEGSRPPAPPVVGEGGSETYPE
jgi:peptidoglycan-N-acetylglucosamine deacetylase